MLEEGLTQVEVAGLLGVSERAVNGWRRRFRRGGWKALQKRPRGRGSEQQMRLSSADQQRIVDAVRSRFPDQLRIPGLLWTRSGVRELIERECGVRLDLSTVGRYLCRGGFTLKRPGKRMLQAGPVGVQAWVGGEFRTGAFIAYLTRRIGDYPDRKVILICDSHSTHHAKDVKVWVATHAERIELQFLPAYSPHLNPDEYLNQDVKRHMRALHQRPTSKPGLKDTLTSFLGLRQSQPEIVRNYFNAPHVQYAR